MSAVRTTIQKKLIKEAVASCKQHPTADEIYAYLKAAHPSISKATIYRNLNQMAGSGEILKVELSNAADRFDFQSHPHYHIYCTDCGKVSDAQMAYMPDLDNTLHSGFKISGHSIVFKGLCPECIVSTERKT